MTPQKLCRFCEILSGKYKYAGIDEPFAANDDYIAIASVGALVEGWTLIIPREHKFSMKDSYIRPSLGNFIDRLLPFLIQEYGPVIAFEHGANTEGSVTSCGTDHAHLHLVPFTNSLLPELQRSGLKWNKCYSSEILSMASGSEYLFYTELGLSSSWGNPTGLLHVLEKPLSQYFRQLIAKKTIGIELYDYKLNPNLNVSIETRRVLSNLEA